MSNAVRKWSVALMAALTLVVLSSSPAFAQGIGGAQDPDPQGVGQEEYYEGFGVGIKGGWLFSNLTAEGAEFDGRTGQQIGVFFGGNRGGTLGVGAELNYGSKGGRDPEDHDNEFKINFVSVPVYLRLNAGSTDLDGISFYGLVGPQFDWLISQKLILGDEEFDLEDDTAGYELSLVAGAGVEIYRFVVELRYIHGLKSISKEFDVANATDLKSKAFAILFGFRFK